ncbi:MAG: response regulator transcription factor [Dehalococcoidia bacterium]
MESAAQVLVVSPDDAVLRAAEGCLMASGYAPLTASTLRKAQRALSRLHVDAICLDSLFPTGEVERLLRWICDSQGRPRPPIVMFAPASAKLVPGALPGCFQEGCDGVVTKPVAARDLTRAVAKVIAADSRRRPDDLLSVGSVALDGVTQQLLFAGGGVLELTPTEFRLLRYLMQRPGQLAPAEELLEEVWGYDGGLGGAQLVRAHVSNLRRKLRALGQDGQLIQTAPYRGYGVFVDGSLSARQPHRKAG